MAALLRLIAESQVTSAPAAEPNRDRGAKENGQAYGVVFACAGGRVAAGVLLLIVVGIVVQLLVALRGRLRGQLRLVIVVLIDHLGDVVVVRIVLVLRLVPEKVLHHQIPRLLVRVSLPGMDMALSKLNSGGWVHIFPEGSRSRDGGKTIAPAKRGVGRLVMDADRKRVIVVVGDPINFDDLLIDNCGDTQDIPRGILYDKVTQRIGQRLQELKVEVDRLAAEQEPELQNRNVGDDGYRLWQQVDWEGFGIGSSMLPSEPSAAAQVPSREAEPEPHLEVEQSVSPAPSAATFYDVAVPHWFQRHVDPSELMGFASHGLIKHGKFLEEGYREFQQSATTLHTWAWIE
uniref:Tafazzin family protein n=1 Tax=Zea mays TaxID=4577 RepID=A0A804NAZ4_MAIZE